MKSSMLHMQHCLAHKPLRHVYLAFAVCSAPRMNRSVQPSASVCCQADQSTNKTQYVQYAAHLANRMLSASVASSHGRHTGKDCTPSEKGVLKACRAMPGTTPPTHASVPLPWCTSKSRIATRRTPAMEGSSQETSSMSSNRNAIQCAITVAMCCDAFPATHQTGKGYIMAGESNRT